MSDPSSSAPGEVTDPRVVVVTGASSGIGRATAILLSSKGMRVVLASRSLETLESARAECHGGETLVVPTDVSQADQVEALMDAAAARFGRVDAVVHSAAVLAYGRFEDVPADVFEGALDVTLIGTANVARTALRRFREAGNGNLVVVGSLLGKIATPYMSSYVTSKWAVHGLVRCLQLETRDTPDINVSLVSPGGVNTPVYLQAGTYAGHHGMPPPPVVSPERVGRAIARRLDHPARDTDVGPANLLTVLGFHVLPGVFDLIVTPLMRAGGLQRTQAQETPGNVLEPTTAGESTHGPWDTVFGGILGDGGASPLGAIGRLARPGGLRWRRT